MSHMVNLVRVLTAATGNSTPITLGAAYSQLFMTMAETGADGSDDLTGINRILGAGGSTSPAAISTNHEDSK